ncbi:hypothetical protein Sjap_006960 [Stephania japonica]|uniref:Uncharacterized protein n=1 Tax=Stephania japonica TaxID=461633 RepID=A0AAP0K6W0_9MAGN
MAQSGNDASRRNGRGSHAHVAIEIGELDRTMAASVKNKLDTVPPSPYGKRCCIYKVHEKFRKINEYAYTPEMVSIGPLHRNTCPSEMQDHKLRYVKNLVARTRLNLEECLAAIRSIEDDVRKCYSEHMNDLDKKAFVELMVVDGLFVIELFCKSAGDVKVDRDDPIFNNIWGMASLVRDMILLENQIPMLVLARLFDIVTKSQSQNQNQSQDQNQNQKNRTLAELALRFFNPLMERNEDILEAHFNKTGKHLLNLFGKTFHDFGQNKLSKSNQKLKHIPCVTELRLAGVKFRRNDDAKSFLDIRFCDGEMLIPPILVQDQTDSLFRNLIASEQACDGRNTYMTSYAFLMDSLINSPNDVEVLRSRRIITNYMGDDKDVSFVFNKLCSEVTLVNFYYHDLCDEVNKYASTHRHRWIATLRLDYFNSPWAVIAFISACILLILTFTSTIFASLSYIVHKS